MAQTPCRLNATLFIAGLMRVSVAEWWKFRSGVGSEGLAKEEPTPWTKLRQRDGEATALSGCRLVRSFGRRGAWPSARVHRAASGGGARGGPRPGSIRARSGLQGPSQRPSRPSVDTTFGPLVLAVPRARLADDDAGEREWKSALLPAYRRLSRRAELLIAEVYLAGSTPAGCVERSRPCSPAASARMPSAAPGTAPNRPGKLGSSAILR